MGKKLSRAAINKEIKVTERELEHFRNEMGDRLGSYFSSDDVARSKETKLLVKLRDLKKKLKSLGGKGGGGMYSPSKPLKDKSLLSMAKKRQM